MRPGPLLGAIDATGEAHLGVLVEEGVFGQVAGVSDEADLQIARAHQSLEVTRVVSERGGKGAT